MSTENTKIKSFNPKKVIKLYDGSTKEAKNIEIGDQVIGLDGKPKKIIDIDYGNGQIYKVTQKLGYSYKVSKNHILVLKFTNAEGIYWDDTRNRYKARYIHT